MSDETETLVLGQKSGKQADENNPSLEKRSNDAIFIERFASLFDSEQLSDVILRVGDRRFHAHKFILVVNSDVFRVMLGETRWRESAEPEVELTEDPECVEVFPFFLKYMYSGSVTLTTDTVLPVLLLADKYGLPALGQTCVDYMLHHVVENPDTNRTLSWYQYAKMTANTLLVDKCRKFILSNFDIILKTADWINLSQQEVVEFVSSSDLVVSDEFHLWQRVENWFSSDATRCTCPKHIQEVVSLLHFTMIPPKQLLQVERSPLYQEHAEAFADKLHRAYRHHSLLLDNVDVACSKERFRNYTDDMYGLSTKLGLLSYKFAEMHDGKIVKQMKIPYTFVAVGELGEKGNSIDVEVVLWAKGAFKGFSWYGSLSENVSMSVRMLGKRKEHVTVGITFIVYGKKNNVRYVAFSSTNRHTFSNANHVFVEDNLIPLAKLKEDKSPYLIHGNFEARIFIKVEEVCIQTQNNP